MRTITLEIPDDLPLSATEAQRLLLCKLYQEGLLSATRAAEILGCTKWAFVELLGAHQVSYMLPNQADQALEQASWQQYADRHC